MALGLFTFPLAELVTGAVLFVVLKEASLDNVLVSLVFLEVWYTLDDLIFIIAACSCVETSVLLDAEWLVLRLAWE